MNHTDVLIAIAEVARSGGASAPEDAIAQLAMIIDGLELSQQGVTVIDRPTFSRRNLSAQAAASAKPPMVVSAMTIVGLGRRRERIIPRLRATNPAGDKKGRHQ